MKLKDQILELHNQGLSNLEIRNKLHCTKGTVFYHTNPDQKEKGKLRGRRWKKSNILKNRILRFLNRKSAKNKPKTLKSTWQQALKYKIYNFFDGEHMSKSVNEIIIELEANPVCYLTGDIIDFTQTQTYELDHKTPKAKGGLNSIENMGLATSIANRAKNDLTIEEFKELCNKVAKHLN